ncbi:MAG: PHP domain-containing protein [Bryobacteraceae bacterium]
MIDLHTHTNESDGSCSPEELIGTAAEIGLEALAISDHDTLAGYDLAVPHARAASLDLVCGIELSTKLRGRTVHLLGYFLRQDPSEEFRVWLTEMRASRRDRNVRMAARLQSLGIDVTLEEVERKGRSLTGRPHFAKVMLQKGYVSTIQQAFDDYLDESAQGYVDREEPQLAEGIERIARGGGISSIAHPIRMGYHDHNRLREVVAEMAASGLTALEAYHSDHAASDVARYLDLAREFHLEVTGGSDFHGDVKPGVKLGVGDGRLNIPRSVLDRLREL